MTPVTTQCDIGHTWTNGEHDDFEGGVKNFSVYSKRFSGVLLTMAGLYIGITNF
jgi:hypothetical protein